MQVFSFGIAVSTDNIAVRVKDMFSALATTSGIDNKEKPILRRIYLDEKSDPDFYLGLVVTIKDQRRFLQLESSSGQFKVRVSDLKGDNKLMEFNFFVINKKNGLGLYQYYHGSCSVLTFGSYLKSRFREVSDRCRDFDISLIPDGRGAVKSEKQVRVKYRGGLDFQQLIRRENIQQILKEYKRIVAFDYELVSLQSVAKFAQPVARYVRKVRERMSFNADAPVDAVAVGISELLSSVRANSARVSVINDEDEPISVRVIGMPENFGEADYDQIADALNDLDLNDFSGHPCISNLKDVCVTLHPGIFMATIK